jgi:hypothetical protein
VVSEALARAAWPGRSPIGDWVYTGGAKDVCAEVVGVVKDAGSFSLHEDEWIARRDVEEQIGDERGAEQREDQPGRDAADLSNALAAKYGQDKAAGMLTEAKKRSKTDYDKADVDEALKRLSGGRINTRAP